MSFNSSAVNSCGGVCVRAQKIYSKPSFKHAISQMHFWEGVGGGVIETPAFITNLVAFWAPFYTSKGLHIFYGLLQRLNYSSTIDIEIYAFNWDTLEGFFSTVGAMTLFEYIEA